MNSFLARILKSPEFLFALACILLRLIPHPPNLSPIGAYALVGATALKFPLLGLFGCLLFTDFFLGFHSEMPFVYGAYGVLFLLYKLLPTHRNSSLASWMGTGALGSITFFLVTNFGVWLQSALYPKSLLGLVLCFEAAIPFFHNTLLGDLFFMGLAWTALKRFQFNSARVEISH